MSAFSDLLKKKKNNSADCLISNRQMSQGLQNGETVFKVPLPRASKKMIKGGTLITRLTLFETNTCVRFQFY